MHKTFSFKIQTHVIGQGFGSYHECLVTVTDLKGDLGDSECTAWLSIHCEDKPVCWGPGGLWTVAEDTGAYKPDPKGRLTKLNHINASLYAKIKTALSPAGGA